MPESSKHTLDPQQWVKRHGDYLYNFAIVRVNDAEKAADLVQETFLSALKSESSFKGNSTERTWLTAILKRKIIDSYRRHYARRETSADDHEGISDGSFYRMEDPFKGAWMEGRGPHSHSLLPEGGMEQEELARIIGDCIKHLPPRLAAPFVMKLIEETESEKICKELGITPSNLWVMLHRARLKMRKCIEDDWMEP